MWFVEMLQTYSWSGPTPTICVSGAKTIEPVPLTKENLELICKAVNEYRLRHGLVAGL